jgi:pimeloyl-ACP methyl ester carboxylesterase
MSSHPIRRRFIEVDGRVVHYLRAGEGPPAVLVHSSPANVFLLTPNIERLSATHTCFAFDTPGFGSSEALKFDPVEVSDLADALALAMRAAGLPACPVFGTHTGAAVALELAVGHPEQVTGLVLDGVPAFTDEEIARYFANYFQPLVPDVLGGHYAAVWTRFRDQTLWFPWCERRVENLNVSDAPTPDSVDRWVRYFFQSGKSYAPAYRAACFYGAKALDAIARLDKPADFMATETDMLHPHLARFPPLKDGQRVHRIGVGQARLLAVMEERIAAHGAGGPAPSIPVTFESSSTLRRQFIDLPSGQILIRTLGDRSREALFLLHDAPGSGLMCEPLIRALARHFFVIAPDLPGCGDSDPLSGDSPGIEDYADAMDTVFTTVGVQSAVVEGVGFGTSVALALATAYPARVERLVLRGVLLPDADERAEMRARHAPPIETTADGGHWYRAWLMLRDSQVYFPWYRGEAAARRKVEADFSADRMHAWTLEVMKQRAHYGDLIHAALAHDAAAALCRVTRPIQICDDPATPLFAHAARLAALVPGVPRAVSGPSHIRHALDVAAFCDPGSQTRLAG